MEKTINSPDEKALADLQREITGIKADEMSLTLKGPKINGKAAKKLAEIIATGDCLITHITFQGIRIPTDSLKIIAGAFKANKSIKTLSFEKVKFDAKKVDIVSDLITNNYQIGQFYFGWGACYKDPDMVKGVEDSIIKALQNNYKRIKEETKMVNSESVILRLSDQEFMTLKSRLSSIDKLGIVDAKLKLSKAIISEEKVDEVRAKSAGSAGFNLDKALATIEKIRNTIIATDDADKTTWEEVPSDLKVSDADKEPLVIKELIAPKVDVDKESLAVAGDAGEMAIEITADGWDMVEQDEFQEEKEVAGDSGWAGWWKAIL